MRTNREHDADCTNRLCAGCDSRPDALSAAVEMVDRFDRKYLGEEEWMDWNRTDDSKEEPTFLKFYLCESGRHTGDSPDSCPGVILTQKGFEIITNICTCECHYRKEEG